MKITFGIVHCGPEFLMRVLIYFKFTSIIKMLSEVKRKLSFNFHIIKMDFFSKRKLYSLEEFLLRGCRNKTVSFLSTLLPT